MPLGRFFLLLEGVELIQAVRGGQLAHLDDLLLARRRVQGSVLKLLEVDRL